MADFEFPGQDQAQAFGLQEEFAEDLEDWLVTNKTPGDLVDVHVGMEYWEDRQDPHPTDSDVRTVTIEWTGDIDEFWDEYFEAIREEWDDFVGDGEYEAGSVWVASLA